MNHGIFCDKFLSSVNPCTRKFVAADVHGAGQHKQLTLPEPATPVNSECGLAVQASIADFFMLVWFQPKKVTSVPCPGLVFCLVAFVASVGGEAGRFRFRNESGRAFEIDGNLIGTGQQAVTPSEGHDYWHGESMDE